MSDKTCFAIILWRRIKGMDNESRIKLTPKFRSRTIDGTLQLHKRDIDEFKAAYPGWTVISFNQLS